MSNTITSNQKPDCSTLANFQSWGSFINSSLVDTSRTKLVQTNEKIQVQWADSTSFTVNKVQGNGTTGTWQLTVAADSTLRVGMVISVTGLTNTGFNGDYVITALNVAGVTGISSNNFQAANTNTLTATTDSGTAIVHKHSYVGDFLPANAATLNGLSNTSLVSKVHSDVIWKSGTTYAAGDVIWYNDGSSHYNTYISLVASNSNNIPNAVTVGSTGNSGGGTKWKTWSYEMWKTNDGLTTAYMRLEYGTVSANVPQMAVQFGNTDSLTADLYTSGNCTNREIFGGLNSATASTSLFECDFCGYGDGSGFICVMFRTATTTVDTWLFGFERSRDNTGATNSNAITYIVGGGAQSNTTTPTFKQCSLFLSGAQAISRRDFHANTVGDLSTSDVTAPGSSANSWQVGSNIPAAPVFANLGFFQPLLMIVGLNPNDVADGVSFTITAYGASHTYLSVRGTSAVSSGNWVTQFGSNVGSKTTNGISFAIRWE
jgi:hypothetical protein